MATSETHVTVEKDETEETEETETEVAEAETKMTQRQFINRVANDSYSYCRGIHQRTHSIIDFLRNHMSETDEKLSAFLSYANSEMSDPRSNPLWEDDLWPDLTEGPMHDPESQEAQDASEFVDLIKEFNGKFSQYLV